MTALSPADDRLHAADPNEPSWTETYWFPFYIPDAHISCYVYTWVRQNLGLAGGGVIVWDESSDLLWETPYARYDWAEPFTGDVVDDTTFPSGVRLRTRQALQSYDIDYIDGDTITLSAHAEGRHPPHIPGQRGDQQGMRGHYDQACHITGELTLGEDKHTIDSYSVRDRSWGPRSDKRRRWWGRHVAYATGGNGQAAFLAHYVGGTGPVDVLFDGFVIWDDKESKLTSGTRTVERTHGQPVRVHATFTDVDGRGFVLDGRRVNRLCFQPYPSMLCVVTTMAWELNGQRLTGEDQDVWAPSVYRQLVRSAWQ